MKLLIEDDQGNRSVVPVVRDQITIGRKDDNAIRLTERNVSRHHARLVQEGGGVYVEDVEARYGIKKNGQEIDERAEFSEGDVVLIGDYRLTLRPEKASGTEPNDVNGAAADLSPDLEEEAEEYEPDLDESSAALEEGTLEEEESSPELELDTDGQAATSDTKIIQTEPASLVVVSSNFAGQEFPLDRDEMVVGRDEDCDIIIDHRSVSGKHAKVVREGPEEYKINDLNSRNGVKIDGEEYKSVHLERGDIVELGHVKFRFVEPGENYVFSPQDSDEVEASGPTATEPDNSPNIAAIGGAAAVAVLMFAGLTFALFSGSNEDTNGASAKKEKAESAGEDKMKKKVDAKIEQAEKDIENGKIEEAITSLESVKDLLETTPEQSRTINDLLTDARQEKPFAEHFESARAALDNENYEDVLQQVEQEIPEHSVFHELVVEQGLREKALEGLHEEAKIAIEKEDEEEAARLAKVLEKYDSYRAEAKAILEKVDTDEKTTVAQRGGAASGNSGNPGGAAAGGNPESEPTGSTSGSGRETDRGGGREESDRGSGASGASGESDDESGGGGGGGGISTQEAKKYKQTAMKKWIQGDNTGAIAACRKALKGGMTDCYRVMGMSFKRQGQTDKACRYLKKYLGTNPSDATKIENVRTELECD